jgi:hypothetical protein
VDHELIKETLSYEMMMTLAIFYNHMLVKEKEKNKEGAQFIAENNRRRSTRNGGSF